MTRAAAAIAVALLSFLFCALPAAAAQQVGPVARPALLTDVKLLSESPVESRFELTFDPAVTAYGPSMGAPNQPAISFPFTSRGRNAVQPRAIPASQPETDMILADNIGEQQPRIRHHNDGLHIPSAEWP